MPMQYRRFGKTELRMPVISCGGMRFQHSWESIEDTPPESDANVAACVHRALEFGINHIETARGYGSSEYQLGKVLPHLDRDSIIVQTKVAPDADVAKFVTNFETSMRLLKLDHVDLFSFHGVNSEGELEAAKACLDTARQWQQEGRVRFIGFSTHGPTDVLLKTVETDEFDYINLHWYFIFQENWPVIEAARARDMGVFIISPNDKAGKLYEPSAKLVRLCAPLHPLVFNGLFCLSRPEVHTLSCGIARPFDFDIHMGTAAGAENAAEIVAPIVARLETVFEETLGREWASTWRDGLPEWHETPGEINIPWILRLRNLALAYDMLEFGKMRYNLLGNGGTWFPGNTAENVGEYDLSACLANSPHAVVIPALLAETHTLLKGEEVKRLQQDE